MKRMGDDEFLWDCAFIQEKKDRLWIIPDKDEFNLEQQKFVYHEYDVSSLKFEANEWKGNDNCIEVTVIEKRENGIMDIIGGEVWEAAILLSSYLLLNRTNFVASNINVLELGCGVGLPSFLLANMSMRNNSDTDDGSAPLYTFTDYEASLLSNLLAIIEKNYSRCKKSENPNLKFSVASLDWSKCGHSMETSPSLNPNLYSFVIGSALCYAPYHAKCLLDVVQFYLQGEKLKEIIICQIKDREGFSVFLRLLEEHDIQFSEQPVPEEVYEYARTVSCIKELVSIKQEFDSGDECWSDEEDKVDVNSLPVQTQLCLRYAFPLPDTPAVAVNQNLVHTQREDFVLVRIFKSSKDG